MATDWEEHYKATVLQPARQAGNALPQDLFVRYSVDGGHRDADRFAARIAETVRYWKKLSISTKVYKPLAEALLAEHAELLRADALNPAEFARRRTRVRADAAKQLDARVASVAGGIPYLTRTALAHLVELTGGLFSEEEVGARLREAGVQVIDPEWDVPTAPPVGNTVALVADLRLLGRRISPQVVFDTEQLAGGFRLKNGFRLSGADGSRLTRERVQEAKTAVSRRTRDSWQTAADNVLTTMLTAADAGALDQLVLWEVAQTIRAALANGMPAQVAADLAADLGLDRGEARELTVTLAPGGTSAAPATGDDALVAVALAGNRLREAQALLAGLDEAAVDAEVRARVQRLAAEVTRLVAEADAAEREGRDEQAAEHLTQALSLAADDTDLAARLGRIPPPPASDARTGINGNHVTVRWTPGPARTGQVTFRVVRKAGQAAVGPDDGDVVAETGGNHAVDTSPPIAEPLVYTIFAIRGASASPGATAPALLLLPPVTGFELTSDGPRVTGSWVAPAAAEVAVTRTQTDADETSIPVAADASGFVDEQVCLGTAYDYRAVPIYRSRSGERLEGPGAVERIVVEHPPAPVVDLAAEILPSADRPSLRLRWTPPAGGRVEIRSAGTESPWVPGDIVALSALDGYGEAVRVVARTDADGRAEAVVPARQGRVVLTAVTRGQGRAVIGNAVPIELSATISGLRARRQWDTVRVDWIWPDGVHEASLRWSTATSGGELVCTRRAVKDDGGGVRLEIGPQAVTVAVRSVVRQRHRELFSPPVIAQVPARPPRVTWWLRATRKGLRRQSSLRLRSDQYCELPELLLLAGEGSGRDGAELGRLPARALAPDRDTDVDVSDIVAAPLAANTTCALADPAGSDVVLVHGGKG